VPGSVHRASKPVRVVTIGGGTGLSALLRGLKHCVAPTPGAGVAVEHQTSNDPISDLVALVTVTDDGGSSGRLRRDYSVLPPGDIRNCMVALSQDEALLARLFEYRFASGNGLKGHSFGNLFLAALSHVTGDFMRAVRVSGEVLAIRGRIFPSTNQLVSLEALLENGRRVAGESRISRTRTPIRSVKLVPRRVKPLPGVLDAIARADLILMGPGSLYTSVIPNLLVSGVADAIRSSHATRIYLSNLMTQPGETAGYSAADHVRAILKHGGPGLIDWVVLNNKPFTPEVAARYRAQGAYPVGADVQQLERMGLRCVADNLLQEDGKVRHNGARLARLLLREFILKDAHPPARRESKHKSRSSHRAALRV
jgi:uncharacterized cofD-like protein